MAGSMYCLGQRPGFHPSVLFSPYLPKKGTSKSQYEFFVSKLPSFGHRLGTRFETFADNAFLLARAQLKTLNTPSFSSTSTASPQDSWSFAGNFAFTFNNFWNKPHVDSDKGKVFCMWYPIDRITGNIVCGAEGFELEGGWFVIPECRIAFKFGDRSVFQMNWSGKSLFHHTLQSVERTRVGPKGEEIHYTRLGCSSQITSNMARASAKAGTEEEINQRSGICRGIVDVQDVLSMADRRWKE